MCVFCEIIKGNIPSKKIYEDDKVLAILDISQATKGHTLIMPKDHFANLYEIDEETLKHLISVSKKLACHYKKIDENILGINILNNNEEAAGQSVMHYHMHLIPRYQDDDLKIKFTEHKLDLDEVEKQFKL